MAVNMGKRKRLSEIAYEEIKTMIINSVYRQGSMLSEKQLCNALNMSRTPVREAIRMLVSEGLLEVRDGVGTFVKEQSQKDIEDAYEVRRTIEILAIQTAMYHFTEEELNQLQVLFQDIRDRYDRNSTISVEEYADADWKLHDMIIQKSENQYVKIVMGAVRSTLKRYQSLSVKCFSNVDVSMNEHMEIIESIRGRDRERLIQVLDKHIRY